MFKGLKTSFLWNVEFIYDMKFFSHPFQSFSICSFVKAYHVKGKGSKNKCNELLKNVYHILESTCFNHNYIKLERLYKIATKIQNVVQSHNVFLYNIDAYIFRDYSGKLFYSKVVDV